MEQVFKEVRMKKSGITVAGLKELLFRDAAALVYMLEEVSPISLRMCSCR